MNQEGSWGENKMAISGPDLLNSHSACEEYGVAVIMVRERIDKWFADYGQMALKELDILGSVTALRALTEAYPILAFPLVSVGEVKNWDEQICRWFELHGRKLSVKRGVSRDAVLAEIRAELGRIASALSGDDE